MPNLYTALARRYAEALYTLVPEEEREETLSQLNELTRLMEDAQIGELLLSPRFPFEQREQWFLRILEGMGLSLLVQNLGKLLLKKRRLTLLPHIATLFSKYQQESKGILEGEGESSAELTPKEAEAIQRFVEKQLGARVLLTWRISPHLLVGFRVRVGSWAWEGSLLHAFTLWEQKLMKRVAL